MDTILNLKEGWFQMSVISLKYRSLTLPIVLKNSDSLFESKVGAISDDYFNFEKELWFVSF